MASIGLQAKQKRIRDRKAGKRLQWYSASYQDLYTTFIKKNIIDKAEDIDEPKGYEHKENTYTPPAEKLPEEPEPKDSDCTQPAIENIVEKNEEMPKPVPKKVSPPLPPKPDNLEIKVKSSNPTTPKILKPESPEMISLDGLMSELSGYIRELEEPDPAKIHLPASPKIEMLPEVVPILEPKSEPAELVPEPKIVKSEPEPYGIPGLSNTSEPAIYFDENLEDLYKNVKEHWESDGNPPEVFDWENLALEIEDAFKYISSDLYQCNLKESVNDYRYKVNGMIGIEYGNPSIAQIVEKIRKYGNAERADLLQGSGVVNLIEELSLLPNICKEDYMGLTGPHSGEDDDDYDDDYDNDDELINLVEEMN